MLTLFAEGQTPALYNRYPKLTDNQLDTVDDLADEVGKGVLSSGGLPLVMGIAVSLGVAGVSGAPIVGAVAGGYFIYNAVSSAIAKGNAAKYIKERGCLAHCLNESQLVRYAEVVGVDAVLAELQQAYRDGASVTAAGKRFSKSMGVKLQRRTIAGLMAELQQATPVQPQTTTQTITGGNAPALPVQPQSQTQPYKPGGYFNPDTGKGSIVLDAVVQSPGISRLLIGGQRTGKSYFAAVASAILAKTGWKVFHVNLASYGSEDDYYWSHVYKSVRGDLSSITDENAATDLIANAIDAVNEFIATKQAILICDEIAFTGSKYGKWDASGFLRVVAEQISALTSTGMKRERAIWALCPELVAGAMKDETKAIKSLNLLYFAIAPGMSIDWNGQAVKFDESVHQQVMANFKGVDMPTAEQVSLCRRHNLPRIAYLGREWLPVGELPKIEQPAIANPSPSYAVVTAAPAMEAHPIDEQLPELYEAIARFTVAQSFEQPAAKTSEYAEWFPGDDAMLKFIEWLGKYDDGGTYSGS